jgi:hypothetical protein
MAHAVLYTYLVGWIVTSTGLALTARREWRPTSVVVVAGAVWPLLVLGVAQMAIIALVAEIAEIADGRLEPSSR